MSRIKEAFQNHKAFIPFITCGTPNMEETERIVREMVNKGADLIELGIPFSDPTAEGPVIMEADLSALNAGTTTDSVFEFTKKIRKDIQIPLVYMTYANVVFSYGVERFAQNAADAGIDGIILPDVPYEEKDEFDEAFAKHDIDLISMIAPTSDERIAKIAKDAKGFLYIVSSLGVTGMRSEIKTDIGAMVKLVKENTDIPCAVGFGISGPDQAGKMASLSDGAIVGSAIMKMIAKSVEDGTDPAANVGNFVGEMAAAVHKA